MAMAVPLPPLTPHSPPPCRRAREGGGAVVFSLQGAADIVANKLDMPAITAAAADAGVKHVQCGTSDTGEASWGKGWRQLAVWALAACKGAGAHGLPARARRFAVAPLLMSPQTRRSCGATCLALWPHSRERCRPCRAAQAPPTSTAMAGAGGRLPS